MSAGGGGRVRLRVSRRGAPRTRSLAAIASVLLVALPWSAHAGAAARAQGAPASLLGAPAIARPAGVGRAAPAQLPSSQLSAPSLLGVYPPVIADLISPANVVFTATINPQGLPTTMHFEYSLVAAGASAAGSAESGRTPEQPVGSDFADHVVTATVAGLLPNRTYRVRPVATNPGGVTAVDYSLFRTGTDPPPLPPVLGRFFNAEPVSGSVYVLLPHAGTVAASGSAPQGAGFIALTEARQLPVGTVFDATRGVARLTSATATPGKVQRGRFGAGLFTVRQKHRERGLTELDLLVRRGARDACRARAGSAHAAARRALPKTVLTLLQASVKGRFRTRGRFSAGTVRGTRWTTSERCDGTLTVVKSGVVVVTDSASGRRVVLDVDDVDADNTYLARAR